MRSRQPLHQPTLPSGAADARLVLALPSLGVAAVGQAVRDVTGLSLPVVLALTLHSAAGGSHATLAAA